MSQKFGLPRKELGDHGGLASPAFPFSAKSGRRWAVDPRKT